MYCFNIIVDYQFLYLYLYYVYLQGGPKYQTVFVS